MGVVESHPLVKPLKRLLESVLIEIPTTEVVGCFPSANPSNQPTNSFVGKKEEITGTVSTVWYTLPVAG
jgi:hypothetical protein